MNTSKIIKIFKFWIMICTHSFNITTKWTSINRILDICLKSLLSSFKIACKTWWTTISLGHIIWSSWNFTQTWWIKTEFSTIIICWGYGISMYAGVFSIERIIRIVKCALFLHNVLHYTSSTECFSYNLMRFVIFWCHIPQHGSSSHTLGSLSFCILFILLFLS